VNRCKMGSLGYDVVARYGLNDIHRILIIGSYMPSAGLIYTTFHHTGSSLYIQSAEFIFYRI